MKTLVEDKFYLKKKHKKGLKTIEKKKINYPVPFSASSSF